MLSARIRAPLAWGAVALFLLFSAGGCCCHRACWLLFGDGMNPGGACCESRCGGGHRPCGGHRVQASASQAEDLGEPYTYSRFNPVPTRNAFAPRGFDGLPVDDVFYAGQPAMYGVPDGELVEPRRLEEIEPPAGERHRQHLQRRRPPASQSVQSPTRSDPSWIYQAPMPTQSRAAVSRRQAMSGGAETQR